MPTASQAAILQNLLVSYEENCGLVAGGSCSHCNSVAAQDISVGVGRLEGAASEAGLQCCSVDSDSADCSESLAGARNNIRSDSPQTFRQVLSDFSTVCNDCRLVTVATNSSPLETCLKSPQPRMLLSGLQLSSQSAACRTRKSDENE